VTILIGIRFLFGLAEAGVYPQATRALHNWTLPQERGLALGLLNMGSRFGAAFGLLATPICVEWLGWRESFALLGIVGVIWAAIWFWRFRDRPDIKLNTQELNVVSAADERLRPVATNKIPWRAFASSLNFYLILYQYFASQFTFFFCLSWLLPFLRTRYGVTTAAAGVYSCIPLCCGALAMWISGAAVDRVYKMGKWKSSRGLPAMIGFGLAALALLPAPFMPNPVWFIVCFALTIFGLDLTVSPSWTVCCDVGEMYSGTVSAGKEVAELAGVSTATVSRALSGSAGVREPVRSRIIEAARSLSYRPNRAARDLRVRSSRAVGVLIPDIENPFFTSLVCGIEDFLGKTDYSLLLASYNEDPGLESRRLEVFRADGVRGLILSLIHI